MSRTTTNPPPAARPEEARRAWARIRDLGGRLPLDVKAPPRPDRVRAAVEWFAHTPRGEAAFLARYRAMRPALRAALALHLETEDPWAGFRVLCRAYGLSARPRALTRL
mgnify:CR=1 FL=1